MIQSLQELVQAVHQGGSVLLVEVPCSKVVRVQRQKFHHAVDLVQLLQVVQLLQNHQLVHEEVEVGLLQPFVLASKGLLSSLWQVAQ